jgi:hypothetical protein
MQHLDLLIQHPYETTATYLWNIWNVNLQHALLAQTSLYCLREIDTRRHLKFIDVELTGGTERPARRDAMPSSASHLRSTPRHQNHWGGREGITTESICEKEAPPEGKERERCCRKRNGHHGCHRNRAGRCGCRRDRAGRRDHRRDGKWHISTTTAGCGPSALVACGGENLILPFG